MAVYIVPTGHIKDKRKLSNFFYGNLSNNPVRLFVMYFFIIIHFINLSEVGYCNALFDSFL